jgi:hypothetical protein
MTGKSSGCSFIAQAPNNTVEARQSAVTVPVNAVLMARALRSIFASHCCGKLGTRDGNKRTYTRMARAAKFADAVNEPLPPS